MDKNMGSDFHNEFEEFRTKLIKAMNVVKDMSSHFAQAIAQSDKY